MGNHALQSASTAIGPDSPVDAKFTEDKGKRIRVGWQVPAHLFISETGESLCGQAGCREEMTPDETRDYTSDIEYPLGHLRNQEEIRSFAAGICKKCLRSYYKSHTDESPTTYLDNYTNEIREDSWDNVMGFCYTCGSPVDPDQCGSANVADEHSVYICEECGIRTFSNIAEAFGNAKSDDSAASNLAQRLRSKLSDAERNKRTYR